MYSLMMKYSQDAWDDGVVDWEMERYLQYTDDGIKSDLSPVNDEVIQRLKLLPTLFTYEKASDVKTARVGWIKSIQRFSQTLRVMFEFDPDIPVIEEDILSRMMADLNIDRKYEVNRSHWAIKDVDLLSVLRKFDIISAQSDLSPSSFQFSRRTLIKACELLRGLSHAEFDSLLLDVGLSSIAGRDKGSLQARSVALATYVVDHINDNTVSGEPLPFAIVSRTAYYDAETGIIKSSDPAFKAFFWDNLKQDGYEFLNGHLVPSNENMKKVQRPYQLDSTQEQPIMTKQRASPAAAIQTKPRIFIVHGRDAALKTEVARFLERLGTEAVILHERPNGGRTLITKFQEESSDIAFAIVLMTPDDIGGLAGESQNPRARQNVIFELGFFIGKLGASKVCALVQGSVEKPSDFDAVVYVSHDAAGAWKTQIARELKHAKVTIDTEALLV